MSSSDSPKKETSLGDKDSKSTEKARAMWTIPTRLKHLVAHQHILNDCKSNEIFSDDFLAAIPKAELHCHLDGGVRVSTLLELAKEYNVTLPYNTEAELKKHVFKDKYNSLEEYLLCFGLIVSCLQTPAALERVAYEFAVDGYEDGVRYFEVRFAPQLHCSEAFDITTILEAVNKGCKRATDEYNASEAVLNGEPRFNFGIIVCALRMFTPEFSSYYRNLYRVHRHVSEEDILSMASMALASAAVYARDKMDLPIVAMDIAGAEDGYPPQTHKAAFDFAHKNFLNITIHAAEGFGPESLFRAITDCHAERIGHGYHIFSANKIVNTKVTDRQEFVDRLVNYVADQRILLEVCLTSNIQTMPELKKIQHHNLTKMLEHKMAVAICTDNRTVSNTTLTQELRLAVDAFCLTPKQLRDIVLGGFKRSFHPGTYLKKREYLESIIAHYTKIEEKYGVSSSR